MARDFQENLQAFIEQEDLTRMEGRRGLTNLCKIVRAIGYKDPQYFGQLTHDASIGDLVCFLEDNSGAIEAIVEWIGSVRYVNEWNESIKNQLEEDNSDDEDD